jgi:hypothetical protein
MKVLDLRCAHGHRFEGWFGSEDDYLAQNGRGLVACPSCGDAHVTRLPSAPRLNLSGAREPAPKGPAKEQAPAPASASAAAPAGEAAATTSAHLPHAPAALAELHAAWLAATRRLVERTEDVGERFAEEARRIHYGETPERAIRGRTDARERAALADEGIEVFTLPLPPGLDGPAQ